MGDERNRDCDGQALKAGDTVEVTLGVGAEGETPPKTRTERWVVACVVAGQLYPCGWPPGSVAASRVKLVERGTPEDERRIIDAFADVSAYRERDARHAWARAEALRRGWRRLEGADLTPITERYSYHLGTERIAMATLEAGPLPGGGFETRHWRVVHRSGSLGFYTEQDAHMIQGKVAEMERVHVANQRLLATMEIGATRQGRRRDDGVQLAPGEYGKRHGRWMGNVPGGGLVDLGDVTEHEDGTITASQRLSIVGADEQGTIYWHGHLERGTWRRDA